MPSVTTRTTSSTTRTTSGPSTSPPPPGAAYVQRGHTVKTVRETETTRIPNKRGSPVVKTRTRTVYYVDDKPVKLNWFDRLRIRFMSTYEKQAFLANKLLCQERKARTQK